MGSLSRLRGRHGYACLLIGLGLGLGTHTQAAAQTAISVSLVQQDFSDCTNANVKDNGGGAPGGTAFLVRNRDGSTSIKVDMTVRANTTYHFFLKCVRQLGDIKTDDEGIGAASFMLPPGAVGKVFAFDMYPEGAPAGNKFQSVQVRLP